jgi:hypothetical protein
VASIGYNDHVDRSSRRRLRSASVQLGTVTALALVLSGCNTTSDDDDDCALGPPDGSVVVSMAFTAPATSLMPGRTSAARTVGTSAPLGGDRLPGAALPEQGGFGTHLASCGG